MPSIVMGFHERLISRVVPLHQILRSSYLERQCLCLCGPGEVIQMIPLGREFTISPASHGAVAVEEELECHEKIHWPHHRVVSGAG